jgi:medium-chain acyl-[acyl-carrier-protein] hydrolase
MMPAHKRSSERFIGLGSNPEARFRLFCFPFAGGAASVFREWRRAQGEDLEIVAVELPGRDKRINERPFRHLSHLVNNILEGFPAERPFAMFGHSMGALIVFELARALSIANTNPAHLFVSSFRAPHLPQRTRLKHLLDDPELIMEVREMGGTPEELIQNDELRAMLLLRLRSDLAVVETYSYLDAIALSCPITGFGGLADEYVMEEELESWHTHTSKRFRLERMAGDHFYLYSARDHLLNSIKNDLGIAVQPRVHLNR